MVQVLMILKKFSRLRNKNCICCILWPLLFFDCSTVISFRCKHDNSAINRDFRVSKTRLLIALVLISALIIFVLQIGGGFQNATSTEAKILIIGDMYFVTTQVTTFIANIVLRRAKVEVFERYQRLLDVSSRFKIKNMITAADATRVRKMINVYVLIGVTISVGFTVLITNTSCWIRWCWINHVAILLGSFSMSLVLFQLYNEMILYNSFLAKFDDKIRKSVSKKIMYDNILYTPVCSFRKSNISNLEDELKLGRKFYDDLMHMIKQMNRFYAVQILLWYIVVIIQTIFNAYMFILKMGHGGELRKEDFGYLAKIFLYAGVVIYYTFKLQAMGDVVEDLTSFLFRYPIGKLSLSEAYELEVLIMTLHLRKPTINLIDILTVGTKLLAPICGTIITYVLVALQFYSSK